MLLFVSWLLYILVMCSVHLSPEHICCDNNNDNDCISRAPFHVKHAQQR